MQNIQSPLQTIYKASNDSLLDTLIPNEVLGIIFDRVVNPDYSSKHISSILFTCKKWKSVLQKNRCISLVQVLFQLKGSHQSSTTISHLQECLTTENESFTSQELKLIDLASDDQRFEQLLMVDSKLFHPKSLFLSLLDRYPWNPAFCKKSANKNIQLVAKEQLSILDSLIFGTDEQRLTVMENDSIAKLYRGASLSATWELAKTSVISTLKKFPNFNDKKIFTQVVRCFGQAVFDIKSFRKDREIILAAVNQVGLALFYADISLRKDREIVLAAVQQTGGALAYAGKSLKKDREIVLAAVKQEGLALEYADVSLKKNREIVLAAVQQDGWALKYANESLKKDQEIVLAAIQQNGYVIKYADASLKKDREIVLAAVQQRGSALEYADESLKKDREIALAAVKQDGWALFYADASLKKDRDIVLAAVKQDGLTLKYADESLKKDRDIVLAAVKQNDRVLEYVSLALRIEIALTSLLQTPKNYISDLALYSVWHL